MQDQEAADLRVAEHGIARELRVDLLDAFLDQVADLLAAGEVGVARIREAAPLGPVADGRHVDVDERAHHVAPVAEGDRFLDVGEELELVLDVVGREQRAVPELADILGPVDDLKVAVRVEDPRVSRVEVTVPIDRFGGGVGPLVVFLQHRRAAHQHLAVVGDLHLDAGRRLAHGIELDVAVRLQAHIGARLRRAVELLHVDADRPIEAEQVRPDRRAGRIGDADPAHPEHVAQRAVNKDVAARIEETVRKTNARLAVQDLGTTAAGNVHEVVKRRALELPGVLHPDHHLRQQVLENPRRREVERRAYLAQVRHHRVPDSGQLIVKPATCHSQ